jgi:hypothetical protein
VYTIGNRVADDLIRHASEQAARAERTAKHRDLRGPEHAADRKRLRGIAREWHYVIAGLNTGEGVTRAQVD